MQSDLQIPWFSQHQPITKSFRVKNLTSNAKWTSFQQIQLLTSPPSPTPHPQVGGRGQSMDDPKHPTHTHRGGGTLTLAWGGGWPEAPPHIYYPPSPQAQPSSPMGLPKDIYICVRSQGTPPHPPGTRKGPPPTVGVGWVFGFVHGLPPLPTLWVWGGWWGRG